MGKNDTKTVADASADTPAEQSAPRLGELIQVKVADGHVLINNETGQDFEPGVVTLQTVTVTTLRRLEDGDLVRV